MQDESYDILNFEKKNTTCYKRLSSYKGNLSFIKKTQTFTNKYF